MANSPSVFASWSYPPGAITPGAILDLLKREEPTEADILRRMPNTLEMLTVLLNEAAVVRLAVAHGRQSTIESTRESTARSTQKSSAKSTGKSTPKSTTRGSRAASRERVLSVRSEHPGWTWQDVADAVGLSLRYTKQLGKEAMAGR